MRNGYQANNAQGVMTTYTDCRQYYVEHDYRGRLALSDVICVGDGTQDIPSGANSSVGTLSGGFWSSSEVSASTALRRNIGSDNSSWSVDDRINGNGYRAPLCVGD